MKNLNYESCFHEFKVLQSVFLSQNKVLLLRHFLYILNTVEISTSKKNITKQDS